MKASAVLIILYSAVASASIARVICSNPGLGTSNCNGDDNYACGTRCGECKDENDRLGYAGYWRKSDNKCDCYCW